MKALTRYLPDQARQRIAIGFITAMLLIAVGFGLSFYSYNRHSEDNSLSRRTDVVINDLNELISQLKDVETGARGFVLTQDSIYLEPRNAALLQLPKRLKHLNELLVDDPTQKQRVDSLGKLVQANIYRTDQLIGLSPTRANWTQVKSYLLLGKMRMDDARRLVAMMISAERALTQTHDQQANESFNTTLIIILLLSVLTFIVLIVSYNVLEAELTQRQRVEDQLRGYEAELKAKIQQLETSNEELERFAFVASHDLQEPLRKIQSFGSILQQRSQQSADAETGEYMSKIMQSAERMSKMIKDLLHFSRLSAGLGSEQKIIRLNDLVRRILADKELQIKGMNAKVDVGDLPVIKGIPFQIEQLFTNLIANALKFIRPGVAPRVQIKAESIDGNLYPELVSGQAYTRIMVSDNGIGFDEKYLTHIFQIFQRLHSKTTYEGTGIGLAICKRVIQTHKGHITAISQPGQGAVFIIILPEYQQPLQAYDSPIPNEVYSYPVS